MKTISLPIIDGDQISSIIRREIEKRFAQRPIHRVLLVNPPDDAGEHFDLAVAKRRRYSAFPPYGLCVIAAHLQQRGFNVKIADLNAVTLSEAIAWTTNDPFPYRNIWQAALRSVCDSFLPDAVGITCMFTMTHPVFKEVVSTVREYSTSPIIIGGVHVTNNTEQILRDVQSADVACTHEAEISFSNLLEFLNGSKKIEPAYALRQIALLQDNRYCEIKNVAPPDTAELAVQPSFDLIPIAQYGNIGSIGSFAPWMRPGVRVATVLSNRGCRAECTFCSVRSFNFPGVRQKPVENVIEELSYLTEVHGIGHVMWLDDDLFFNQRRTIELFNRMVQKNLKLTWDASNGVIAAAATADVIAAAAESGCIGLIFGIESGNEQMLREMKKPGTLKKFREAAAIVQKYPQIFTQGFLMMGFPHETLSMMMETMDFAIELGLDWYKIAILQPLPSTPIYKSMLEEGLLEDRVNPSDVRYNVGPHGSLNRFEHSKPAARFRETFARLDPDAVPPRETYNDIWFHMNYRVNFDRMRIIADPVKRELRRKYLADICDRITSDHALANLFSGIVEDVCGNSAEAEKRLILTRSILDNSPYWQDKFEAFELDRDVAMLCANLHQR